MTPSWGHSSSTASSALGGEPFGSRQHRGHGLRGGGQVELGQTMRPGTRLTPELPTAIPSLASRLLLLEPMVMLAGTWFRVTGKPFARSPFPCSGRLKCSLGTCGWSLQCWTA